MEQLATGVDVIELSRVRQALDRHGERFLRRIYTPAELTFCRGRLSELAARFAAKEATMKALGTGVRGVGWREIEVMPNRRGKPMLNLYGRARARAEAIGLQGLDVSLTHSREYAAAVVVGLRTHRVPEEDRPLTAEEVAERRRRVLEERRRRAAGGAG
ncbi:MAG TPA: holo-ACP synthase [Dehalococcoidia bacterium]